MLGVQIRDAREAVGMTQLQLAEMTSVKREHISNIEHGKNSPAVNIVTDIAKALNTAFQVDGCTILPGISHPDTLGPVTVPEQMRLDFGVEYRFDAQSVTLAARNEKEVELRAILSLKCIA